MPVYPGAPDLHLQAVDPARRTKEETGRLVAVRFFFKHETLMCEDSSSSAAIRGAKFMELKINKVLYEVTDPDELRVRLAQIRRTQFSEVWMQHAAGWPAIGALINGELRG